MPTCIRSTAQVQHPATVRRPTRRRCRRAAPLRRAGSGARSRAAPAHRSGAAAGGASRPSNPHSPPSGAPPADTARPPAAAGLSASTKGARWLADMQLWGASVLRGFGVREQHLARMVLEVFAQLAAEWSRFQPPDELPARTARRRWMASSLLRRAAEDRAARRGAPPGVVPPAAGPAREVAAGAPQPGSTGRDLLRWLERATTPARWRVWLARVVDDLPASEIARQEGCSFARVRRRLDLAQRDLMAAFAHEYGDR